MSLEMIPFVVFAVFALVGLLAKLLPKRKPKSPVFKCSRCGTASRHDERTSEAWRRGKKKFFCRSCHVTWLQSRPQHSNDVSAKGGAGCLGVVALFFVLPLAGALAWAFR